MKIVFVALASSFTPGMNYQENMLAAEFIKMGVELTVVSDSFEYVLGKMNETTPGTYILEDNLKLIRCKYVKIINTYFSKKFRKIKNLISILENEKPDIIYQHGIQMAETKRVVEYVKTHPKVMYIVDSHEDYHNSATNFLSKNILHKLIYKPKIKKALPYIDKYYYISSETKKFLIEMYKIKSDKLSYLPLGGIISDEQTMIFDRNIVRNELGISDENIVFLHSGKMGKDKKTIELLNAFIKSHNSNQRLLIVGSFSADISEEANRLIDSCSDIKFLGWKQGDEIIKIIHASDIYMQPGTQSATMQNAMCGKNLVVLYPYESHKILLGEKCHYIETEKDMEEFIKSVDMLSNFIEFKNEQFKIAENLLDYKAQCALILNNYESFIKKK